MKRRDFWDWLFGRGFDVKFGACFKKGHMYMCERMGRDGVDGGLEFLLFDFGFVCERISIEERSVKGEGNNKKL